MKKDLWRNLWGKAAVMLLLPWLAVTVVPGDAGMAVCFLLFFAVDPAYALLDGWHAGKAVRRRWWYPAATALFFLLGAWLLFDPGEPAFLVYALIYAGIGTASMGICAMLASREARGCQ